MLPIFHIGPAVVPTAPLLIVIGLYLSMSVAERAARAIGLADVDVYEAAATSILAGFVIGRVWFVFVHIEGFLANPLSIVWPLTSGYTLWVGVIGGWLVMLLQLRSRRIALRPALLALLPAVLTALLFISLADFIGLTGTGAVTTLPWGIERAGIAQHPVGLYEALLAIIALGVWRHGFRSKPARTFWLTVAVYGFGRFFLDAFRTNSPTLASGHHVAQLVLLPLVLIALFRLGNHLQHNTN